MKHTYGFTLIEMMIVIAIIGVMSAIALPAYSAYIGRAQVTEGFVISDVMRQEIALYVWENRVFPPALEVALSGNIGSQASGLEGKYINSGGVSITADTGVIIVEFSGGNISGKNLILTPRISSNTNQQVIQWACSGTVSSNRLPSSCL